MPGSHTTLLYHVIFSTKNRRPYLQPQTRETVFEYLGGTARGLDAVPIRVGGWVEHVHLLVKLKPAIAVARFVGQLKSSTSKHFNETSKLLYKFGWQDGYGAFSVSPSQVEKVRAYIENQESHHTTEDFKTEYVRLLDLHEVQYDPRFLWD